MTAPRPSLGLGRLAWAHDGAGRPLGGAEWIALAIAVTLALFGLDAWFAPGFMSFDSLLFYQEALEGVTRSTWPPMYAYLIRLTRALGGDYGALFLAQSATVIGFGGFLTLRLAAGPPARRLFALALFLAAFFAVPPLLGTLIVLWNVVPVAGLMLAGAAFQLVAWRRESLVLAICAVAAYAACVALRYDSAFLIAPEALLLAGFPTGARSGGRSRLLVAGVAALAFAAAVGSFSYRLPDLKPLPFNAGLRTMQTFDLIGISAVCGENRLTPEMTAAGPVSVAEIRGHYDPRHLNISLAPKPGLAPLSKPFDTAQVDAAWRRAVRERPGCYLRHRWRVFSEQMGVAPAGLFYATHGGIDPNRFGLTLARPERAERAALAVARAADDWWRRPAWLYVGALAAVIALGARRDRRVLPLGLLTVSALAYAGCHLFVAPAADARYIFPSSVLCAVVIAAALGGRRPGADGDAALLSAGRRL